MAMIYLADGAPLAQREFLLCLRGRTPEGLSQNVVNRIIEIIQTLLIEQNFTCHVIMCGKEGHFLQEISTSLLDSSVSFVVNKLCCIHIMTEHGYQNFQLLFSNAPNACEF